MFRLFLWGSLGQFVCKRFQGILYLWLDCCPGLINMSQCSPVVKTTCDCEHVHCLQRISITDYFSSSYNFHMIIEWQCWQKTFKKKLAVDHVDQRKKLVPALMHWHFFERARPFSFNYAKNTSNRKLKSIIKTFQGAPCLRPSQCNTGRDLHVISGLWHSTDMLRCDMTSHWVPLAST